jgi:predicted NACHT family NTPase
MTDRIYSWKRFWCPRSGRINLADGGYLCDPEAEWGNVYNPDLVTFEAISKLPCLVLLGEPGMGKTHAMTAEQAIITTKIQEQGGQVLLRDLRSYSSPEWLARKLFDSAEFTNWLKGTHQLHIFLDIASLNEL